MEELRKRINIPCPSCGKELKFSAGQLKRHGDFQIGCPYCKAIVWARNALSKLSRAESDPDASAQENN
jgi:ssDNA-binding Zn-finger/Zn-ribbon topoisomerase 1